MTVQRETLLGLDNVELDLPIAPFPLRILAALVDYFLFGLIVMAFMIAGIFGLVTTRANSPWFLALFILGYFVLEYGYFVGLEILMRGQTPGKRLLKIRVATRSGGQASSGAIAVRNIFRSIDMMIGIPFMILSPSGQRIGDRLAETLVLETAPAQAESIVRRAPAFWGQDEIAVAEELLRRSASMDPHRAHSLAERLLEGIAEKDPAFLGPLQDRNAVDRLRRELSAF